jgi:hypothetical protein
MMPGRRSADASSVAGLTGVIAVAGGDAFSLAFKGDGKVWAWVLVAVAN